MISRRGTAAIFSALFGTVFFAAVAAHAARPVCVLKSSGSTFTSPITEKPCTGNMNANGGTHTHVKFDSGCVGGIYSVDVVFEHGDRTPPLDRLGSFQGSLIYDDTKLITPSCTPDPENYFYEAVGAAMECPASFQGQKYLWFGAHANDNVDPNKDLWPTSNPNFRLMRITFASLGFTEDQTTTMTFYDETNTPQGNGARRTKVNTHSATVSDANLPFAEVSCTTPCTLVKAPTNASVTAGSVVGTCTETSGERNVTISFANPTQCVENGVSTACSSGCSPGTKVERVSPNPATLSLGTTSNSVTDTCTIDGTTTPYIYRLTGVCTTTGYSCAPTSVTATLPKCVCGPPPSPTNVKINGGDTFSFNQGMPITITGIAVDSDSSYNDITVTLHYVSGGVVKTVAAIIAQDKTFTVNVAGADVVAGQDIYFGLIQKDEFQSEGPYPPDFDPDDIAGTGVSIDGRSIKAGTKLDFIRQPYPNQFPFRAGGERLVIDFALNESAIVTTRIYAADGSLIREISNSALDPEGNDNVCYWEKGCSWDGTSYLGGSNLVSNGLYIVNISAMGTGQSFGGQTLSYTKGIVVMK